MLIMRRFEKLFDILGEIAAFLTIALIAFLFLNAKYEIISGARLDTLKTIREYMILGTLIIVGFEFAVKRGLFLFLLYVALAAVALVFSFPALF